MEPWMTNGAELRKLSFEELEAHFEPLIYKFSNSGGESRFARGGIAGYDPDDFAQEVRLVLWKCQESFSPETKAGYQGRPSTFINFFIHAVENKFGKLRASSDKYHRPVTQMQCVACNEMVPPAGRAKCPKCGARRWQAIHGSYVANLDDLLHDPPAGEADDDYIAELLAELPPELVGSATKVVNDIPLEPTERRALRKFGRSSELPPEMTYAKSTRGGY